MALVLQEEMSLDSVTKAFERACLFFSRINKLASTAMVINDFKDGEFKDALYKQDCIYYQLEAIRDLSRQFEVVFDDVASTLGWESDEKLKALKDNTAAEAELIADFQAASETDHDFILVQSHFMSRKYWTEGMRGHLSELAKLCEASDQGQKLAEVLLKDSGEGVLAGNVNQAQPSASIVNVVE